MNYPLSRNYSFQSRQQGAVLYVAMIMLVLLALIGIVGMQVAGIQERMAGNYRTVNLAFQNTEALARSTECELERMREVPDVPASNCAIFNEDDVGPCGDGFDAGVWAGARVLTDAPARNVREIQLCMIGESEIGMGLTQETGGRLQPIYQITTYQTDTSGGANPSSSAAIDTIFKL